MIDGIAKAAEGVGAGTVATPAAGTAPVIPQMLKRPVAVGAAGVGKPTGLDAVPPTPALTPPPTLDMASAASMSTPGPIKTAKAADIIFNLGE